MKIILKLALYCLLIYAITLLVPGVVIDSLWPTAVIAGLVFYLVNIIVKPVIKILTFPINIITLGLFYFIINAACFWLVGYLVNGFEVLGFQSALVGSIIASVGAWIISVLLDSE